MPHRVLNEDWSDYDNRKKRYQDRFFFSCDESWEVDYLIKKIKKYKNKSEQEVRNAIMSCCRSVPSPRPRKTFVECVISKL